MEFVFATDEVVVNKRTSRRRNMKVNRNRQGVGREREDKIQAGGKVNQK